MKYRSTSVSSHSDALVARFSLIHCIAWGLLLTLPAHAWAQSAWSWRSNTAVTTQQFQGGRSALLRRADSRLQVRHTNGALTAFTSGRYAFDHALPADPAWRLARTYQLQPTLESAWLQYAPSPLLSIRLGRHDIYDHQLPARIDGITVHAALPALQQRLTLTADFSAGWRTSAVQRLIDDDTWAAPGLPYALDDEGRWQPSTRPATQLVQASVGMSYRRSSRRLVAIKLGTRRELIATRDIQTGDRLLADGTFGDDRHAHLRWALRYHLPFATTERATVHAVVPISPRRTTIWDSGLRFDRVILPLDSPFIIYDTSPSIEAWSGVRSGRRRQVSLLLRRQATSGSNPLATDARQLAGVRGELSPTSSDRLRSVIGASALAADALHQQVLAWTTFSLGLRRGPDLHAHGSFFMTRDERSAAGDNLLAGGWLTTGATFRATPWAHVNTLVSGGINNRVALAARVMVTADIRLPGGRP